MSTDEPMNWLDRLAGTMGRSYEEASAELAATYREVELFNAYNSVMLALIAVVQSQGGRLHLLRGDLENIQPHLLGLTFHADPASGDVVIELTKKESN